MDILWGADSGLVLKTFSDHKVNLCLSDSFQPIIIYFIEIIDLTYKVWDILSGNFVHNNLGHEYDIKSVLLFPMKNTLDLYQMTQPVCFLIHDCV